MTDVDRLLVAEVESAMRIPRCMALDCLSPADWVLVAPCGHTSKWCDVCHLDATETIGRLVEAESRYVCWGGDGEGMWADFRWEALT